MAWVRAFSVTITSGQMAANSSSFVTSTEGRDTKYSSRSTSLGDSVIDWPSRSTR